MKKLAVTLAGSAAAVVVASGPAPAADAADGDSYSAPLTTAIGNLPVAKETRTGYNRDKFRHWIDADGDGCNTRQEVLIAEAVDSPTIGASCALSNGSWWSYYDQATWTNTSDIDIDHMVALAEAWDSGARRWTDAERQAFANDLGDDRSLVGVTDNVNQSKGDQDIAEWLPTHDKCRYLGEFVAVKIRWSLAVDAAEKTAMQNLAATCDDVTIAVTLAR